MVFIFNYLWRKQVQLRQVENQIYHSDAMTSIIWQLVPSTTEDSTLSTVVNMKTFNILP